MSLQSHLRLIALATLLTLTACGDDNPLSPDLPEAGVHLRFTGDLSGSISAVGTHDQTQDVLSQTFASAATEDDGSRIQVLGVQAGSDGRASAVVVDLHRVGSTGEIAVKEYSACQGITDACAVLLLGVDLRVTEGSVTEGVTCYFQSGSVTLLEKGSDRVVGRFSGSGFCLDRGGAVVARDLRITEGTFNVPVDQASASPAKSLSTAITD